MQNSSKFTSLWLIFPLILTELNLLPSKLKIIKVFASTCMVWVDKTPVI